MKYFPTAEEEEKTIVKTFTMKYLLPPESNRDRPVDRLNTQGTAASKSPWESQYTVIAERLMFPIKRNHIFRLSTSNPATADNSHPRNQNDKQ